MVPLPFTLLFGVHVYTTFLCFLSREDPLAFVEELVWWCMGTNLEVYCYRQMFNTDLKYVHFQDLKNVHVPNLDGTSISLLSQWKFPSTSRFIRIFCYSEIVIM